MGAVEDPGSAGGGGELRAGEGTERLERGREEGGKETFEPSGPGLGRAGRGSGEGGGRGSVGGTSRDWSEGLLDSGSPGIRTEFVMLKLGPPLSECSFAEPKLTGRGGYSRGVCLEEPRWSTVSAGIQSRGSGGREGRRRVRVLLRSARPLSVERSGGN